ncbi:ATP-binding protein [Sphingomonas sp. 1P06PA]|uniref:ATP-binding protein n=1 Tax=Sphingomonas sp. 1P06PA TaxID=554121 RepID=UPI0039A6F76F
MIWRARGLPIVWQTLLLLLASLIVTQALSIGLFLSLRPPRPDFNRLSDIAEALSGTVPRDGRRHRHDDRDRALSAQLQRSAPGGAEGMATDPAFTAQLADRLRVPATRVRLFFEPDQRGTFPFDDRKVVGLVPIRRGEPIFFNTVIAGLDTGAGWRVVQTPPRPMLNTWQRRTLIWFGLSALLLAPFAFVFARRLTRPIRRFADAADAMGSDPLAPKVPEEGPAELRVAANALNRMQGRLEDYVAERTAMIGAIAHDLRTPLTRIAFRIEAAPDQVRDKVQADIEQMRAMIAATIGFVKGMAPVDPVPVRLDALLRRLAEHEREVERPVRLGSIEPVTILGDPVALERLLQNLIDNGVDYGKSVELILARSGEMAEVRIADRGPGVPAEWRERLFQPFQRGEPSRSRETGGIGLGLTIARAIAQAHGGTLRLEDRVGGGIEAIACFPIRADLNN